MASADDDERWLRQTDVEVDARLISGAGRERRDAGFAAGKQHIRQLDRRRLERLIGDIATRPILGGCDDAGLAGQRRILRGDNDRAHERNIVAQGAQTRLRVAQALDEDLDLAAAGKADALDVLLLADAKFQQLRLPGANRAQAFIDHGWLDTAAADRAANLHLLGDSQRRADATRSRAFARDD